MMGCKICLQANESGDRHWAQTQVDMSEPAVRPKLLYAKKEQNRIYPSEKDCISPSTSATKFGGLWRLPNPPPFRGGLGGRKILQAGSDHSLESKMAKGQSS
jgi:hypothetical protein